MKNNLIRFFVIFIAFVILLVVLYFVLRKYIQQSPPQSPRPSTSPSPSPRPTLSYTTPGFNSLQTITSKDENTFNFILFKEKPTDPDELGYLTYRNERDLKKWGVKLPVNYTHVRMNGRIIELITPSSSDSRGKILDLPYSPVSLGGPATIQTTMIEFGTFF